MFSGQHTPKISYVSLIKFLAGAFVLGSIWGPFGVHVGSMWAVGEQSELVTPSGEQFDPPWTDLGAFLDPMLAPCWAHAGPMLEAVGRVWGIWERLRSDLELILRPFLKNIEQKVKGRGWILEKPSKTIGFC